MSEGNGNGANSATYQILDKKIDSVEREIRSELSGLRVEFADLGNRIADKIDKNNKQTNPYQLVGTAVSIILALGSAGAYVSNNINTAMLQISSTLAQEVRDRVHDREQHDQTRNEDHNQDSVRLDQERRDRDEDRKRVYAYVLENEWPRVAQVEFEKRMDERRDSAHEQIVMVADAVKSVTQNS